MMVEATVGVVASARNLIDVTISAIVNVIISQVRWIPQ